jgi:hypothetical protein
MRLGGRQQAPFMITRIMNGGAAAAVAVVAGAGETPGRARR